MVSWTDTISEPICQSARKLCREKQIDTARNRLKIDK